MKRNAGIALIAVMAALMVLSTIALGLAASVQTEARVEAADWDQLQGEQLARSGQEFASYLEMRGLRKTPDFMAGLPFEAVVPGFHYRAQLPTGSVDIYFESDNGKLDLSVASPEILTNFFTLWSGDATKAQLITASIEDWRDSDNDARPNGAEAPYYAPLNYTPRNGRLGIADLPLIRGLLPDDFGWKVSPENGTTALRDSVDNYVTSAGGGSTINVNFAPELILRSVPGLAESQVSTIVSRRVDLPFEDINDLRARIGLPSDSPGWQYLTVARNAPSVSSIGRLKSGVKSMWSERRVMYAFNVLNAFSGVIESKSALGRLQRNVLPSYIESP